VDLTRTHVTNEHTDQPGTHEDQSDQMGETEQLKFHNPALHKRPVLEFVGQPTARDQTVLL
jgi:hypothetical protein